MSGTIPSALARMHLHQPGYGPRKAGRSTKTGATTQETCAELPGGGRVSSRRDTGNCGP